MKHPSFKNIFSVRVPSLYCLLVALCVGGCSSDLNGDSDSPGAPGPDDLVPLCVQTNLDASVSHGTSTRANVPNNGSIGVFCTIENGYTAQNDIKYSTGNGSTWTAVASPLYLHGGLAHLCAYYPYGEATLSGTTATLTAQAYSTTKDLCYASSGGANVCNKTPNATFSMIHAYSRVKVNIQRAGTYLAIQGPCAISSVGFASNGGNGYPTRALDLSSDIAGGTLTTAPRIPVSISTIAIGATDTSTDLLFPPQDIASGGATLYVTVDGEERSVVIPASLFSESKLKSNSMYTISVQVVGLATLVLNGTKIDDGGWGSIPGSSNGDLSEVQPQT